MIEIRNLSTSYGEQNVLKEINLDIKKGEFIFLNGSSGSGKTTLLKILYRDIESYLGEVLIENKELKLLPKYEVRRTVGTIFQNFELLSQKTALENVKLAGEVLGRDEKILEKEAYELLEKVGLKGKENRFPEQLSGGEQQRVAIARALLNKPKVILGDEPTGNLDPENANKIIELLKEINEKEEITMVIVTHSKELVKNYPSRVITVKEGRITDL